MFRKYKKIMISIFVIGLFIAYYIGTDPDSKIFANLSYGASLVMTLQIFIIASVAFWLVEVVPDLFVDNIYGVEHKLVEIAKETAQGASNVLIAKSIRILAYSIITAASIIAFTVQ